MSETDLEIPKDVEEILNFWFTEIEPRRWFNSDPEFDATLKQRFGALNDQGSKGELDHWMETAPGALALVILLDQMSRNIYRGTARAFAQDAKAIAVTEQAIAAGFDAATHETARAFFYIPFMHSESMDRQNRCIDLIRENLGEESGNMPHAVWHREVIEKFGRFPFRNAALGRISTPEEEIFLANTKVPD